MSFLNETGNDIKKIVITGGPCAGKTTAMERIKYEFEQLGYKVIFVSETATELISGGVSPQTMPAGSQYQRCQIKLQYEKEKVYEFAAREYAKESDVLIVCDRGVYDSKGYVGGERFNETLNHYGFCAEEILKSYDAVFHLVTAANGAEEFYSLENNRARSESAEEAVSVDENLKEAWSCHPYQRIIGNSGGFENKMTGLINEIKIFLNK